MLSERRRDRIARNLSLLDHTLLRLLSAHNDAPIPTKIALQKEMFLVANYLDRVHDEADFEPHSFGPYSEPVENTADQLIKSGLVRQVGNRFELTELGRDMAIKGACSFTKEEHGAFEDFKEFLNDLTNDEILLFIYVTFPQYAQESLIYDQILANRTRLAQSLYRKGKVSLEKAAQLAGRTIESFLAEARA
jgi:hypothetical protein